MLGLMQDRPLLISQMIDFAARYYPDVEIVTRTVEGPIHRYGYRDAAKRAKQIAEYPWFKTKKAWQKEIELMLKNGFKLEVESLISKDISYVTDTYVPARLKEEDWLD